jgi:hypothetical protein
MQRLLSKPGRKVPILCEILTDLNRTEPLDGSQIISRLEDFGYRCVNAIDMRPFDTSKLILRRTSCASRMVDLVGGQ